MNTKGIEESNEKQEAFMKDNLVKSIHLPYKWFSQSRFSCEQEGGSGGAEQDKGLLDTLGTKIVSEKKEARENKFVSLVGRTSALVH